MHCNSGFLRDGALLVLTLITDEEDDGDSRGDPSDWYDAVVAGRDPAAVDRARPGRSPQAERVYPRAVDRQGRGRIATRIIAFAEMFAQGRMGDICAADYAPFFDDAVTGIADACNVAIPPR